MRGDRQLSRCPAIPASLHARPCIDILASVSSQTVLSTTDIPTIKNLACHHRQKAISGPSCNLLLRPAAFYTARSADIHISTICRIAYKLLTSFESLLLSKVTLLSTVVEFGGIAAKKSRTFLSSCCAGCDEDDMTLLQLDQRSVRTEKSLMLLAC